MNADVRCPSAGGCSPADFAGGAGGSEPIMHDGIVVLPDYGGAMAVWSCRWLCDPDVDDLAEWFLIHHDRWWLMMDEADRYNDTWED